MIVNSQLNSTLNASDCERAARTSVCRVAQVRLLGVCLLSGLMLGACTAPQSTWAPDANRAVPVDTTVYASRDQIRACLDQQDQLNRTDSTLQEAKTRHSQQLAQLQNEAVALSALKANANLADPAQVQAIQTRTAAYNAKVAEVNRQTGGINAQADKVNALAVAYNAQCSKLVYRPADRDAVLQERGQAPQ